MLRPLTWELAQAEVQYRRERSLASVSSKGRARRSLRAEKGRSKDRPRQAHAWAAVFAGHHRQPAPVPPC